ncbi:ABC transporter permease [Halobacillus fulvus]|nr:ABC transporter permease [Halobacillus fulvus]
MQWLTIFRKECLESTRNFKWMWVPLVFILLCIVDPLTTYYLPQILEATGGLPEGSTFEIPTPPPAQVMMMSVVQMNTIGILILALITMGTIAGEKKAGIAELVLVKPVSYLSYVTAKWAAYSLIILASVFVGLLASWYYVNLLFGELAFSSMLVTFLFYGLWMVFLLGISLFMNTLTKSPGLTLFFTMSATIFLSAVSGMLSHLFEWSPAQLTAHLNTYLASGSLPDVIWGATAITIAAIALLLFLATITLKKKELA